MTDLAVKEIILPGATIGVLGSGQLGRMFAIAARRMGYRVHTFSPNSDTPTGQVADFEVKAAYDDLDAVREFARGVNVVTFEFENVSARAIEAASAFAPVRPSGLVLHTAQHRLRDRREGRLRGPEPRHLRVRRRRATWGAGASAAKKSKAFEGSPQSPQT